LSQSSRCSIAAKERALHRVLGVLPVSAQVRGDAPHLGCGAIEDGREVARVTPPRRKRSKQRRVDCAARSYWTRRRGSSPEYAKDLPAAAAGRA
jgi:hypothetical protein